MKQDCQHVNTREELVSKPFLDKVFTYTTDVCVDCGASLWTPATSAMFSQWLSKTDFSRDRLIVQFFLNQRSLEILEHVVDMFPGSDRSSVVRALVSVYMLVVLKDREISDIVETVTSGKVFKDLNHDARNRRVGVQFNPMAMLDICDWANILDVTNAKFIEEVILRMLSIVVEKDERLKMIWEQTLRPSVELALKAA